MYNYSSNNFANYIEGKIREVVHLHNSPHENNIVYSLHDELSISDEYSFLRRRSQRKFYDKSGDMW